MKRLWGIRHLRFFYLSWKVHRMARVWAQCGIGLGVPNPIDLAYLNEIWSGKI